MNDRVPGLDGLRGLAVAMVVLGHFARFPGMATSGVHLFFALSGYLITRILVREFKESNTLGLRRFYWRRALRIIPAYLTYVGVSWFLTWGPRSPHDFESLITSLTYTENYGQVVRGPYQLPFDQWPFERFMLHMWSLAVEEQFYLLWPVLILMLGLFRLPRFLVAVGILIGTWRAVALMFLSDAELYTQRAFETNADFLAMGCLVGVLSTQGPMRWPKSSWAAVIAVALGAAAITLTWGSPAAAISMSLSACLMSLAVGSVAAQRTQVLEWQPLRWLGIVSYSLYLWHIWARSIALTLLGPTPVHIAVGIALSLALASMSYYAIERPILRWRDRKARSSSTRDVLWMAQ